MLDNKYLRPVQNSYSGFFFIFIPISFMKTLNISISEIEYNKFGIKKDSLSFSDFVDLISRELSRQTLDKCIELSEKFGLSDLTMDEISKEVKAVRKNAKSRR